MQNFQRAQRRQTVSVIKPCVINNVKGELSVKTDDAQIDTEIPGKKKKNFPMAIADLNSFLMLLSDHQPH